MKLLYSLVVVISVSAFAQKPSFTLEQVMSSPFPTGLTAADKAPRIAWVFDAKGERNIWIADAPSFEGRQVTHYQGDNGQDIFSPKLTPDGKTVVYARGSEVSHEGHVANPATEIKEPKQQVWAADVETGKPRLLGEMGCDEEDCEDIQLSPDGAWAVWVGAKHHLWISAVAGDKPARQLTELRGKESEHQWSPDGTRIAFQSDRGDHSFIAVYTLAEEKVHYIAPTVDHDYAPRWSNDGHQIAYIKTSGAEAHQRLIPQPTVPWSIWLANADAGIARRLWKSGDSANDSLPPNARRSFKFGVGGRIVFCSERDGRNHLYAVSVQGGDEKILTPGDFDVEDVTLSPDKSSIFFTSNQNDVDRRHVWQVDTSGFAPKAITKGASIEWLPVPVMDGSLVSFGSSATTPAMPYHLTASGREMIARNALPVDFPTNQLVEPKQVTFKSDDGLEIHGQLFVPRKVAGQEKGPALIFAHGGPPRQMMLGFHYMYYYHNAYAQNQYLANLGYTVLSVNYRLGVMYGASFRQPANSTWRGASEYKDILAGAKYLQGLDSVDRKRIGIWGGSYGGLLTALALARNSDVFAAGVDFHGVHDWSTLLRFDISGAESAPDYKEAVKLAFDSSAVASVDKWKSPVLLIHGDDDRNVPFQQTTDLVQRLRKQNVQFEELIFPDEIHDFLLWKSWVKGYRATAEFFGKQLGSRQ
jgi:dipeptidyl aminopeptidase/acylaminoacyl peptidase